MKKLFKGTFWGLASIWLVIMGIVLIPVLAVAGIYYACIYLPIIIIGLIVFHIWKKLKSK